MARWNIDLLEEIELTAAGKIDFTSISQAYSHLMIFAKLRSNEVSDIDQGRIWLNNDKVATNYEGTQVVSGNSSSVLGGYFDAPQLGYIPGANAPSGAFSSVRILFPDYTNVNKNQLYFTHHGYVYGVNVGNWIETNVNWETLDAVNRITIEMDNDPTNELVSGCVAQLFGLKG